MGPFGCVKNRDFLCAVAVDGTLSFFEQETFVFEAQLPMFLLPSPIAYVEESDVFVTLSADWYIEGYRLVIMFYCFIRNTLCYLQFSK